MTFSTVHVVDPADAIYGLDRVVRSQRFLVVEMKPQSKWDWLVEWAALETRVRKVTAMKIQTACDAMQ